MELKKIILTTTELLAIDYFDRVEIRRKNENIEIIKDGGKLSVSVIVDLKDDEFSSIQGSLFNQFDSDDLERQLEEFQERMKRLERNEIKL